MFRDGGKCSERKVRDRVRRQTECQMGGRFAAEDVYEGLATGKQRVNPCPMHDAKSLTMTKVVRELHKNFREPIG